VFAPPHHAGWAQLVTLRSGSATLRTDRALAFVTPAVSVWLPAGTRYALDLHGACAIRIAYVAGEAAPDRAFGPVAVSPVLGEIVERATLAGYLDPSVPRDARLIAVAFDELFALAPADGAVALTMPRDPRLRAAIDLAVRARDERLAIADMASIAACSLRSFERTFLRETGLTARMWLRRARLGIAAAAIAAGEPVTEAGLSAGYTSPSAFIAAYRSVFGETPGRARRAAMPVHGE
jgi:AraC-like DNA-binding protein